MIDSLRIPLRKNEKSKLEAYGLLEVFLLRIPEELMLTYPRLNPNRLDLYEKYQEQINASKFNPIKRNAKKIFSHHQKQETLFSIAA